jgi:hypothetical protein
VTGFDNHLLWDRPLEKSASTDELVVVIRENTLIVLSIISYYTTLIDDLLAPKLCDLRQVNQQQEDV